MLATLFIAFALCLGGGYALRIDLHGEKKGLFCSELSGNHTQTTLYNGPHAIYVAHADASNLVVKMFNRIPVEKQRPSKFVSVIGSMSGLNGLMNVKPTDEIIFFDTNPWMVEYGEMLIELIKTSKSRAELLSSFFGRQMRPWLLMNNLRLIMGDKHAELPLPTADQSVIKGVRNSLHPRLACAYDYLQTKYVHHSRAQGSSHVHRNCEDITVSHDPNAHTVNYPSLNGKAYNLTGGEKQSHCSWFYGYGWMENEKMYDTVRSALLHTKTSFIAAMLDDIPQKIDGATAVVYVSNIEFRDEDIPANMQMVRRVPWAGGHTDQT